MINLLDFIPKKDNYYVKKNFSKGVQSCDIGLVRTYGFNPIDEFVKNKINSITGGIFNHVFFVGKSGDIIEAELSGVKLNKITKYVENDDGVLIYRCKILTEEQKKNMLSYAYAQVGKKYDVRGMLKFLVPFVRQDPEKFFCSELVNEIYNVGLIKILQIEKENISPNDLFFGLKKNRLFFLHDWKNLMVERIV